MRVGHEGVYGIDLPPAGTSIIVARAHFARRKVAIGTMQ